MKAALLLSFLLPFFGLLALGSTQWILDTDVIEKIQERVNSLVSSALKDLSLVCTSVFTQGALVACPSGYKATACSCGSACGSWDIRSDTVCHCQCRGIDWTSARCCQIRTA
ncbi:resistin [Ornithorhynchus anatinus]|uniref:Resistin n=1 Tax=Ornithorhynchus anatinus TaxID=9258 RepID=F7EFU0_ORNAN|nr:resistin [Ornithorhynchus anatinus]